MVPVEQQLSRISGARHAEMRLEKAMTAGRRSRALFMGLGFASMVGLLTGCDRQHAPGGPYYFSTANLFVKPLRPRDEITEIESKKLAADGYAFGIAYFDANGHLGSYERMLNGVSEWKCEYFYTGNGTFEHEHCRDLDGSLVNRYFNSEGELVRTEPAR